MSHPGSTWTHGLCESCWEIFSQGLHGCYKEPLLVPEIQEDDCCMCGKITRSGIYIRWDPNKMPHCDHGNYARA